MELWPKARPTRPDLLRELRASLKTSLKIDLEWRQLVRSQGLKFNDILLSTTALRAAKPLQNLGNRCQPFISNASAVASGGSSDSFSVLLFEHHRVKL